VELNSKTYRRSKPWFPAAGSRGNTSDRLRHGEENKGPQEVKWGTQARNRGPEVAGSRLSEENQSLREETAGLREQIELAFRRKSQKFGRNS
jgi:hypothetical protein